MDFVTIEDRVDRLEALFGQFMTEMAVLNKRADERNKLAEERNKAAEERNKAAEERMKNFSQDMAEFKAEMRADRKEMNRQWGALSNKLGHIVEDIMAPNLPRLARDHFHITRVDEILIRVSRRNPENKAQWGEFDAIVAGPGMVLLGEAKTTPSIQYAEAFAAKLKVFTTFFPHYQGHQLIGVFGSWSVPEEVERRLTELGIYCLQMGEETMDLTNADKLES